MPRAPRIDVGEYVYHVINRANARMPIFRTDKDYKLFEELLVEAQELFGMRIMAYTIMPNHWHLLLNPEEDGAIGIFMHWLTTSHATRYHAMHKTIGGGHVYQGRYKSFLVDTDNYFLAVLKYIERNPARAKLVREPETWRWGSAYRRMSGSKEEKRLLAPPIVALPRPYQKWINQTEEVEDVETIRRSVNKSIAYGSDLWRDELDAALKNGKSYASASALHRDIIKESGISPNKSRKV